MAVSAFLRIAWYGWSYGRMIPSQNESPKNIHTSHEHTGKQLFVQHEVPDPGENVYENNDQHYCATYLTHTYLTRSDAL